MARPIRIRCTDDLGNIAYVYQTKEGNWSCVLSSGTPATFWYAGVSGDEMQCRFALEDSTSPEEALAAIRKHGSPRYTYTLV